MMRNGCVSMGRGGNARYVRLLRVGRWALIGALAAATGHTTLRAQAPPPEQQLIVGRNSNMLGGEQILRLNPFEVRGDVLGRADNEPSCAISTRDPNHIMCGANTYRMVDVPGVSATSETRDAWQGVYQSVTGGETWESTLHPGFFLDPQPHVLKLFDFRAAADATVRSGPAGMAFYSGIAFKRDKSVNSLFVSTFADLNNRENDTMPFKFVRTVIVDLKTAPRFIDKPWIHVEAAPAGQTCKMIVPTDADGTTPLWASTWWGKLVSNWLANRWPGWTPKNFVVQEVPASIIHVVYSIFQDTIESKADLMYSRSTNCGATFSIPRKLSAVAEPSNGAAIAKAAVNGSQRVFAAWRRVQVGATAPAPNAILAVVSNNNGGSWSVPKVIAEICPFEQRTTANSFRTTAFPTMTADATGRAYLAWSDRGRLQNGTCDPFGAGRIMISTSIDGVNWSPPYRAVQSSTGEHQIMPSLAFTAGKLFLAWVDFAQDVSGVFGQFVDEANLFTKDPIPQPTNPPTAKRHTADVRLAMAVPVAAPNFSADVARVSKYLMGKTPSIAPHIPGQPVQLQWNAVNRRWARKMTVPFDGDYIDIATRPFLPPDPTANPPRPNWTPNNGLVPATPTVVLTWTDNRDMRDVPPSKLNPDGSVPFAVPANMPGVLELGSGASIVDPTQTRQMCVPGDVYKTGTTNQNVYAARALVGFAASTPNGNKALGAVTRSFVVYVRNDTAASKTFRIQIANQPPGGVASFDQFTPGQTFVEPVIVARYSGIARTVFVSKDATATALDAKATVRVDVTELVGGTPAGTDSILLNADRSAPEIDSPEIDSREIYLPEIDSPEIDSRGVGSPEIDSPEIDSPEIDSETLKSLGLGSPEIDSPEIDSPEIDSPEIDSPEIDSAPLFDFKFEVTNTGNTTAQYNAKSLLTGATPGAFNYQLIVRRKYALRAVKANCEPTTVPVSKVLVNVLNVNPQSPEIDSPEIDSSAPGTASFALPPGVTGQIIVRARKLNLLAPNPTLGDVALATQQAAVNTDDAAAGITEAPVITSFLSVSTPVLPAGVTGAPYSRQLESSGGQTPFVWSATSGLLPPGLTLSASGLIAGTPTTAGTYAFAVEVRDSSAPQQIATRAFSITITQAGVVSLAFVTQPSPVVFGQPIDPPVSVRALNANGSFAAGITITVAIGSGDAALSGTVSAVTGATGIAVFPTLSIDTIGTGYTLVASAVGFPSATSVAFPVTSAAGSGLAVFNNRIAFLTATGATNATGPLPNLGLVDGGPTVGRVTFSLAPGGNTLSIGGAFDWYPGLPGNDIALGYENLQVSFASPVTAMGFLFVEPNQTVQPVGGIPADSPYLVTLFNGEVQVGSFSFNAPDDQIAFVGVSSSTPFTRATIIDSTGNADDEYFGEFYTSSGAGVAYVVTNTNNSGPGSLRQAITAAVATPSADSVIFNIPGEGARTINLLSSLPAIVATGGPINIDGTTQAGFTGVPIIEVDGGPGGPDVRGLQIFAGSSTVRGLMINRFGQNGIGVASSGNNTIIGNWIGLAPDGVTAKPNATNGVHVVDSPANTIGGATPLAANVVSGNAGEGVRIDGTLATGNVVTGNFIGTTAAGDGPLGNSASGVFIRRAPGNSVIGNIVRYNAGFAGVAICGNQGGLCGGGDIGAQDNNGNGNAVHGNFINSNAGIGLSLDGVANTVVGTGGLNNISGNGANETGGAPGVSIFGAGATGNQLSSNAINSNNGDGVQIVGAGNTGNRVQGNSFINNTDLAIDLGGDGVTANDPLDADADSGPNNLQNFPVITAAGPTTVAGNLQSAASTMFSIQLYESTTACGVSGQGETLFATFNLTTDANGIASFSQSGLSLTAGKYIMATATDPSGNTSEFSACVQVSAPAGIPDLVSAVGEATLTEVTFRIRYAPGTFSATTTLADIMLDTDENTSTGHPGTDSSCSNDATVLGSDYLVRVGAGAATLLTSLTSPYCNSFQQSPQALTLVTLSDGMDVTFPLSAIGEAIAQLKFKVITYTRLSPNSTTGIQDRFTAIGQAALVVNPPVPAQ